MRRTRAETAKGGRASAGTFMAWGLVVIAEIESTSVLGRSSRLSR